MIQTQPLLTAARRVAPVQRARRTVQERQQATRNADAVTASKLWSYVLESGSMAAAKLAIKIDNSLSAANQFVADDFEFEGERYKTASQLTTPPTRLSQAYLRRQGNARRLTIKAMVASYVLAVGYWFRFYTLTMPNLGVSFELTLDIIDGALRRLKRSAIWRENVKGAYDKIEWTTGKQMRAHNHVHAHVMAAARFLDQSKFTEVWTRCVRRETEKYGVEWQLPDGHLLSVKLETKTFKEMIFEMTKYIAKPSDYAAMSGAELVEIDRVLRGRRLLNSYGDFNNHKGNYEEVENEIEPQTPNLDTGTQLNSSSSLETEIQPTPEAWNVDELARWRRRYELRMERQRVARLEWLLQRHRRSKIVLGNGEIHRGAARLEAVARESVH